MFAKWRTATGWHPDRQPICGINSVSTLSCVCGHESDMDDGWEPGFQLAVGTSATTLPDLVAAHLCLEPVPGFDCPSCGNQTVRKRIVPLAVADYIVLALKRFSFEDNEPHKLQTAVDFRDDVTLRVFDGSTHRYSLRGIVEHCGEHAGGGHYIAHVKYRRSPLCPWWTLDGAFAERRSIEGVFERQGYLLLYKEVT